MSMDPVANQMSSLSITLESDSKKEQVRLAG